MSGSTLSDAYRAAYSTSRMKPAVIHVEASRLMASPKVALRVEALQRVKDRAVIASSLSDRELVLTKLREFMETAQPSDSAKIRACELIGKSCGMFKDVIETVEHRSTDEILADIDRRLAADEESLH